MSDKPEEKRGRGWGRPFQKGQSGNPKGRPGGKPKKNSLEAETRLEREAATIIEKAVELALKGDKACLRICLDRLVPVKKDSPFKPGLPKIGGAADIPQFLAAVAARFEEGEITATEARSLKELAESYRKLIETVELEPRVTELEQKAIRPRER